MDKNKLNQFLTNNSIEIKNYLLNIVFHNYSFYFISEKTDLHSIQDNYQNFKESKVFMINYFEDNEDQNDGYFVICFKKTLLFINNSLLSILQQLFLSNPQSKICFLTNCEESFKQQIQIKNTQMKLDSTFKEEIKNFENQIFIQKQLEPTIFKIWTVIKSCIIGYLIKQSYSKLKCIEHLNEISDKTEIFKETDFIQLRNIGFGSSFQVILMYHIEKEELYAIKKPIGNNKEFQKLLKREIKNYHDINFYWGH